MAGRFFIMVCRNDTEGECIKRNLFGTTPPGGQMLRALQIGDTGFLLNIEAGVLHGIFEAESQPQMNIEPDAWQGRFPVQVRVKPRGKVERLTRGSEILSKLGIIHPGKKAPSFPVQDDPTRLQNLLAHFPQATAQRSSKDVTTPAGPIERVAHVPRLCFGEVAGLEEVKSFIHERMIEPALDPELASKYRLRLGGGVLLYGPPGTGKTLIAQATAGELEARFEEMSPSVIRGYPGDPEQRLEILFRDLHTSPRAVLFLDEADALLARREEQKSSVMERITAVLLSQLSGIFQDRSKSILLIAATNAPWKIDEALLRPGRLDECLYVGPPDESARLVLLRLYLRDRPMAADLLEESTLRRLGALLSGYSGADIEQIVDCAALEAYRRSRESQTETPLAFDLIAQRISGWPKSIDDKILQKYHDWAQLRRGSTGRPHETLV